MPILAIQWGKRIAFQPMMLNNLVNGWKNYEPQSLPHTIHKN